MYDSKELDTNLELVKAKKQSMKLVVDNQQLTNENQALQARVAELEQNLETATNGLEWYSENIPEVSSSDDEENIEVFKQSLNKSPKQSLSELRYNILSEAASHIGSGAWCEELEEYANQLRKESE